MEQMTSYGCENWFHTILVCVNVDNRNIHGVLLCMDVIFGFSFVVFHNPYYVS